MSSEQKQRILRVLSVEPQSQKFFTEATISKMTVSARHVERWVDEMTAAGLIFECDGLLHITKAGEDEVNRPTSMAHGRTHCTMNQPAWTPPKWTPVRSGADEHQQYKSRGV